MLIVTARDEEDQKGAIIVRIRGDSGDGDSDSDGEDVNASKPLLLPNENEDNLVKSTAYGRSSPYLYERRSTPKHAMPCHTAHLIIRVLRIIPRHVVLRTRHRRQVPVDLDSLHAEEVLAHEADLPVDVGRVLGVVVLQRETVGVVHEALWEASASDLKNKG